MPISADVLRISYEGFSGEASGPLAIASLVLIVAMLFAVLHPKR